MVDIQLVYLIVEGVEPGLDITHPIFKYGMCPTFIKPVAIQLFHISITEGFEPIPLGVLLLCITLVLIIFYIPIIINVLYFSLRYTTVLKGIMEMDDQVLIKNLTTLQYIDALIVVLYLL